MNKIALKKTLNLHKYSVRAKGLILNWKFILPIAISIAGLTLGSCFAKGEGKLYLHLCGYIKEYLVNNYTENLYSSIIIYLLIPTIFAVLLFFSGLSVYGGIISNVIPAAYSFFIGLITYFFYSNYTLKGLAYCVIIIFPYAVLSLLSLIIITGESIIMSQQIVKNLNRNSSTNDYSFKFYYINCMKSYSFIIIATVVKVFLERLFIGLFNF